MLAAVVSAEVFAVLFVFLRVGAAMMLMPGFSEAYVNVRARLLLGLAISVALVPVLSDVVPAMPSSPWALVVLAAGEVFIGVFLGTLGRLLVAALSTAGMIIATMSALANALVNDPTAAQQGSIAGSFLAVTGLLVMFALDLHHLLLGAVVNSYDLFRPGQPLPMGDISESITNAVSRTFLLAFQMSTPFIAVGLVFYLGLGMLSRLMPQLQVFFIAMPLQITLALVVLLITLPALFAWYAGVFRDLILPFAGGV